MHIPSSILGVASKLRRLRPFARLINGLTSPWTGRLLLTPDNWREVLRVELISSGFEHDVADLIARRVIERLVRAYLGGRIDAVPSTQALDEAA